MAIRLTERQPPRVADAGRCQRVADVEDDRVGHRLRPEHTGEVRHGEQADVVPADVEHAEGLRGPPVSPAKQKTRDFLDQIDDESADSDEKQRRRQLKGVETHRQRARQGNA